MLIGTVMPSDARGLPAEMSKSYAQWLAGHTKQPLKRLVQRHDQEDRT
jgi:hypothetical protein